MGDKRHVPREVIRALEETGLKYEFAVKKRSGIHIRIQGYHVANVPLTIAASCNSSSNVRSISNLVALIKRTAKSIHNGTYVPRGAG